MKDILLKHLILFSLVLFCTELNAQVRLIQISDQHSSLETIAQQLQAIDLLAQDFLVQNPKGEVVVYVIGDFTSINTFSQDDGGQLSFKFIKILKDKGYTVLFTPGNHDAFDWSEKIDGAELFLDQMAQLYEWDVPILAANIIDPTSPFKKYLSSSYHLKTIKNRTHIVGMTLDILLEKSNLSELRAPRLFAKIENYKETINMVLKKLRVQDVKQVILGVHQGHLGLKKLAKNRRDYHHNEIIHYLGADDHLVTAYKHKGALITDAGAYGSFNVIDYNKDGSLMHEVLHVAINESSFDDVSEILFFGEKRLNLISQVIMDSEILNYSKEVSKRIDEIKETWNRVITTTEGFKTHKMHMKLGRTDLGSTLAESLELWVRQTLSFSRAYEGPVISMVNSSSYRVEQPIPAGELTELMVREMYPYFNEATVYRLSGQTIEKIYFKLREVYSGGDPNRYSPQLNFTTRENNKNLEVLVDGKWKKLKKKTMYPVAFDGWLSTHRYGQGFKIKTWIKALSENVPIATKSYQDVLVDYFHRAVENSKLKKHKISLVPGQCEKFLAPIL